MLNIFEIFLKVMFIVLLLIIYLCLLIITMGNRYEWDFLSKLGYIVILVLSIN